MTNVNDLYPSKYVKASDIGRNRPTVTIETWRIEKMAGETGENKPVIYFVGKEKGLVLNRTNAQIIESFLGSDIDRWVGKPILLYVAKVPFQGRMTDAIRVDMPPQQTTRPPQPSTPKPAPAPQPPVDDFQASDEDVPF